MTMKSFVCAVTALILFSLKLLAQGPLTPPGAPAATMKTLQQLEPRTPISELPFAITQPGAYYLTTNLTSTGDGIVISAANVTLDLRGFTITGNAVSGYKGVYLNGSAAMPVRAFSVRNGVIENFQYGIYARYAGEGSLEDLVCVRNTSTGICLYGNGDGPCSATRISACTAFKNGAYGILLQGLGHGVYGTVIEECEISENTNVGLYLYGNQGHCADNRIEHCLVRGNNSAGIQFSAVSNTVLQATSICAQNGAGILLENTSEHNTLTGCLIAGNSGVGIQCGQSCNGNRIEGNRVVDNGGKGIWTFNTAKNLIVRNICIGQTDNFVFDTDDTYGPVVTNMGVLATTGAAAHPWANFSRP